MATITINGITISGSGNISIVNNRVVVDGKDVTPDAKEINIDVEGSVETLSADSCNRLLVNGNVGSVTTVSGNVTVEGSIGGSVKTVSGGVRCGTSIGGSVQTISGDISRG